VTVRKVSALDRKLSFQSSQVSAVIGRIEEATTRRRYLPVVDFVVDGAELNFEPLDVAFEKLCRLRCKICTGADVLIEDHRDEFIGDARGDVGALIFKAD